MLVSSYASLPGIVAATGCLAVMPESLARSAAAILPLRYGPIPFPTDAIDWTIVWHVRNDEDPALKWLRNSLLRSVIELSSCESYVLPSAA